MKTNSKHMTILIGLDGGEESAVAAYLLKKQGHTVIGLGVLFTDSSIPGLKCWNPITLDKIKEVAEQLEIAFYGTDASKKFYYEVIDEAVSSRVGATHFETLMARNKILLEVLDEKRKSIKADVIATGHFMKVLKNHQTGIIQIISANDLDYDESYGLAKVSEEILERCLFPLADVKRSEIKKISDLLSIDFPKDDFEIKKSHHQFAEGPEFVELVEKQAPLSLRDSGELISFRDETTICEHKGRHHFYIGQNVQDIKVGTVLDKSFEVIKIIPQKGLVYIGNPEKLKHTHVRLIRLLSPTDLDRSKPIKCFAKSSPDGDFHAVTLFFKNNNSAIIEFDLEQKGLCVRGTYFVLYNKMTTGRRIICSGETRMAGFFDDDVFKVYPKTKEEEDLAREKEVELRNNFQF